MTLWYITAGEHPGPGDNVKVTRRVELDSSEVSDCAYMEVMEAPTK